MRQLSVRVWQWRWAEDSCLKMSKVFLINDPWVVIETLRGVESSMMMIAETVKTSVINHRPGDAPLFFLCRLYKMVISGKRHRMESRTVELKIGDRFISNDCNLEKMVYKYA